MKQITLLCLLAILSAACGKKAPVQSVTLAGEISGDGASDTILLLGNDRQYNRMDTFVLKEGRFSATLEVDTFVETTLLFADGSTYPLFMGKGDKIRLRGSADRLPRLEVSGNAANEQLTAFYRSLTDSAAAIRSFADEQRAAENFIKQNPASFACIPLLRTYFARQTDPDYARIERLINSLTGELRDNPYVEWLYKRAQECDKLHTGKPAPYFRLRDNEGNSVIRSDYRDRFLLVHFWASWDSLSRSNNAMYRRLYKQIKKEKQFSLLGVSLDVDSERWKEVLKTDTLLWKQVCDFGGWSGEAAKQFAIQRLPANILINPQGVIEAKDMDEHAIEAKIKEVAKMQKQKK